MRLFFSGRRKYFFVFEVSTLFLHSFTLNHNVREVIGRHAPPSTNQPRQQRQQQQQQQQQQPRQPKASSGSLVMLISISPQKFLFLSLSQSLFRLSLTFPSSSCVSRFSKCVQERKEGKKRAFQTSCVTR